MVLETFTYLLGIILHFQILDVQNVPLVFYLHIAFDLTLTPTVGAIPFEKSVKSTFIFHVIQNYDCIFICKWKFLHNSYSSRAHGVCPLSIFSTNMYETQVQYLLAFLFLISV